MEQRRLQIDVKGPLKRIPEIIECNITIDGRSCRFYTSRANYEALIYDKVFLRSGQSPDSAGILNTTNVFLEQL